MKQVNLGFYRMVLFLLLGLFTSVIAYSQQISVKGIVKDQIGEPVIGANVLVRGTTNGVITNLMVSLFFPLLKVMYWLLALWVILLKKYL